MLAHEIKERIEKEMPDSTCFINEFSGGTDHYNVTIISDAFDGKTLLLRHRMVMDLFQQEINSGEIHAFSIKALTKKQWESQK